MLIETTKQLKQALGEIRKHSVPPKKNVLFCSPDHFRVEYAINPFMKDSQGNLQAIDFQKAKEQWQSLRSCYESLGLQTHVLEADPECPDMVFAANQSFPFWREEGKKSVLLSRMHSPFRRPEVAYFRTWYEKHGYDVFELQTKDPHAFFEGNGDALVHDPYQMIWGGFGHRTTKEVYAELAERFGFPVILLKLVRPEFYHLDTCFSILNEKTVVVQPEAFEPEGIRMIHEVFDQVIPVPFADNLQFFCGNCHSPNGVEVITQKGAKKFRADLEKAGFHVLEQDTSEFMKSGGSVFCLKMMVY